MRKHREISDPTSCLNKANDDEILFVLIGRDPAMPVAIQAWIDERVRLGKNTLDDPQMTEAREVICGLNRQTYPTDAIRRKVTGDM
jgi:hypothetical protein